MRNRDHRRHRLAWVLAIAVSLGVGMGCVSMLAFPTHYEYFGAPAPDDAWSNKISGWQRRERVETALAASTSPPPVADGPGEAPVHQAGPGSAAEAPSLLPGPDGRPERSAELRSKYRRFRAERKREVARDFTEWIQSEAKNHYVADGPIDHWATLEETLESNGDDCDGLELLIFYALRDLGFEDEEVFRSIVFRPSDGQHHMVTLWFEDPNDPWVIDPTGAMSSGMRRMSQLPEWVPLKVFSDTAEYTVRRAREPVPGPLVASQQ